MSEPPVEPTTQDAAPVDPGLSPEPQVSAGVTQNGVVTAQGITTGQCIANTAKTTYNDNTNAVQLLTAGPNGSIIYRITAVPRAAVAAATQLQLYRSPGGAPFNLFRLALMPVYAMSVNNIPAFGAAPFADIVDFGYSEAVPLRLKALEQLWVGIGVALGGGIVFDAQGEDL